MSDHEKEDTPGVEEDVKQVRAKSEDVDDEDGPSVPKKRVCPTFTHPNRVSQADLCQPRADDDGETTFKGLCLRGYC